MKDDRMYRREMRPKELNTTMTKTGTAEYTCNDCEHQFSNIVKIIDDECDEDDVLYKCPKCLSRNIHIDFIDRTA